MKRRGKENVGYGDPECLNCPNAGSYNCKQAVILTKLQISAGILKVTGHLDSLARAAHYEGMQNDLAVQLGCKPAKDRI